MLQHPYSYYTKRSLFEDILTLLNAKAVVVGEGSNGATLSSFAEYFDCLNHRAKSDTYVPNSLSALLTIMAPSTLCLELPSSACSVQVPIYWESVLWRHLEREELDAEVSRASPDTHPTGRVSIWQSTTAVQGGCQARVGDALCLLFCKYAATNTAHIHMIGVPNRRFTVYSSYITPIPKLTLLCTEISFQ